MRKVDNLLPVKIVATNIVNWIFPSDSCKKRDMFWCTSPKNSFFQATRSEQADSIDRLISQGTFKRGYHMFLVLAALIVTPGLFLDNMAVVIGGMILAPLLVPLLSLSLSLVTGNIKGITRSLRILFVSILIVLLAAAVMTIVLKNVYDSVPFYPQIISPGVYIFIAFCSGIAGAFAWVKEDYAPAIAGVATAVALLPPLCMSGIGLALGDFTLLKSSLIIFAANLLGITMAAFLVFWILGFLKMRKVEEKVIEKEENI